MKYSKISDQAADVASTVTETVGEAVSTGLDRSKDLVSAAADRMPDTSAAADWTRQHVPVLTPKSRGRTVKSWLPLVGAIAVVVALVWWFRRESDETTYVSTRS